MLITSTHNSLSMHALIFYINDFSKECRERSDQSSLVGSRLRKKTKRHDATTVSHLARSVKVPIADYHVSVALVLRRRVINFFSSSLSQRSRVRQRLHFL